MAAGALVTRRRARARGRDGRPRAGRARGARGGPARALALGRARGGDHLRDLRRGQARAHRHGQVRAGELLGRGQLGRARPTRASPAGGGSAACSSCGSRSRGRWSAARRRATSAWRSTYRCQAGADPGVGLGSVAGRRALPARTRARPAGARRPTRPDAAAERAGRPPGARPGASCSRSVRGCACRASRGSAARGSAPRSPRTEVVMAPPSPKQPRFLAG